MPNKKPPITGDTWERRDKFLQVKVTQTFKNNLKEASEKLNIDMSDFTIEAINEKISRGN